MQTMGPSSLMPHKVLNGKCCSNVPRMEVILITVILSMLLSFIAAIMSSLGVTQFRVELDWTTNMGHVKSFLQCTSQGQALISLDDVPSFFSFFPGDFSLPKISFLFMFFDGFLLPKKLWSNPLQIEIDFPH